MATHSSILAWRIPGTGAWWVGVYGVAQSWTRLKRLSSSMCAKLLQFCLLLVTPWTVALQAPLSLGFSRQEYWSGLPFPSPGYLPNPGIKPMSAVAPALQVDSSPLSHWGSPKGSVHTLIQNDKNC